MTEKQIAEKLLRRFFDGEITMNEAYLLAYEELFKLSFHKFVIGSGHLDLKKISVENLTKKDKTGEKSGYVTTKKLNKYVYIN